MSSNITINPLPPGMNSLAVITPCLRTLMIGHTFLILLLPLLAALFYYSTPCSRRQPIFILNVIAIILAFAAGVASDALNIHLMLSQRNKLPVHVQLAVWFIGSFQATLSDAILLVRLITVHPPNRIGLVWFTLLMSLPIALKVTRMVNIILYINKLSSMANGPLGFQRISAVWLTLPYLKIEWMAQVVDNSYASIAFIWTIWNFRTRTTSEGLTSVVTFRESSFTARIRILTSFALSNFIIPTLLSIVLLILIFQIGAANPFLLNDLALVNARLSIFGVVFATVWAGKEHRREENMSQNTFHQCKPQYTHEVDACRRGHHQLASLATNSYQNDNVSSTIGKDTNDPDHDLVEGPDHSPLPSYTRKDDMADQSSKC